MIPSAGGLRSALRLSRARRYGHESQQTAARIVRSHLWSEPAPDIFAGADGTPIDRRIAE